MGRLAQLVRALALQARGHWFESSIAHQGWGPHPHVELTAQLFKTPTPSCYTHLMWGSFVLSVAAGIVVLAIGFAGGYAFRWYRSRIKVSLSTHIQQSWSDRSVHMSIANHGKTAIILDSWTVHMPLDDLLPRLGEKVRKAGRDDKPPPPKRFSLRRRVTRRTCGRLYRRGSIGIQNELSREIARSMLPEVHIRHQMLDPGTTQRIEPGESTVRTFPQGSANPQEPKISTDTETLTIIPSCHVVGHRRHIWGWPTILGGGPIPTAVQLNPSRTNKEDW